MTFINITLTNSKLICYELRLQYNCNPDHLILKYLICQIYKFFFHLLIKPIIDFVMWLFKTVVLHQGRGGHIFRLLHECKYLRLLIFLLRAERSLFPVR